MWEKLSNKDLHHKLMEMRDRAEWRNGDFTENSDAEGSLFSDGEDRQYKVKDLKGLGDLKFSGITDPVEYLSRFKTKIEVYQINDLTKCRLLVATRRDNAHQWFKRLLANSIRSWRQMSEMFLSQFRASVAYAPPANTLANIKQKDNETLNEYLKCFNDEVSKAEPHKVVEESLAKLKKDNNPGGSGNWGKNKRNKSYSPKGRGYARRTSYGTTPYSGNQAERSEKDDKKSPITVNTAGSQRSASYKYPAKREAARYTEYTPLTAPIGHILKVGDKSGIFRKPARNGPPGRKDMAQYCAFHDANGHETGECRHLKDHIEDLIRKGFLT
ncbi:uncharacterized protein LOC141695923 [Apium graveolens]|uniref:uncharacterized protein LOC141695923 n=1 Tax=Apium graveolens TaxID=4045 RepID=UPI003D794AEE